MTGWTKTGGGFGTPTGTESTDLLEKGPTQAATGPAGEDVKPAEAADESGEVITPREDAADDAPPPKELPEKPVLPSSWSAQRSSAPKLWSAGTRTDSAEKRVVHEPLAPGIGDGKSVFMIFGLKMHAPLDQSFLERMREHITDDVETLQRAGYTVVVDEQGTHQDFLDAVYGQGEGAQGRPPAAILWTAHGLDDGSVETCDGGIVRPDDLDASKVSPDLKLVIFASCYVGSRSRTWRKALGGKPLVVGWGRPVTVDRAVEFFTPDDETETDLDDLIRRYLLVDNPVPGEERATFSPMAATSLVGRKGELVERMETVVAMLGAKWKDEEKSIRVDVPLGEGRWQWANVFVVDSTAPYTEGEPLLAVESDIGEISEVVSPEMLLSGVFGIDYARIGLVQSDTDMPRMVAQGYLPLARARNQDLAALIFHVCSAADVVERRVFGGDSR
jgi:hypothetical protein